MSAPESPELPYRRYVVGDVIELRLTLTHEQNLESIWVIYGRESSYDNTITLQGEIDDTTQIESDPEGDRSLPRKRSVVILRMVVDVDHRPGVYHLVYAACRTASNMHLNMRTYDALAPTGELSGFHVVEEPTSTPWADLEFIDDTEDYEAE
jgi:hypothetical protein